MLLSGYMLGYKYIYCGGFQSGFASEIISRLRSIVMAQYLLVFTASLPVFLFTEIHDNYLSSTIVFLFKSVFFLNQISLLHILPMFIPLFIISIPVISLLAKNKWFVVGMLSVTLFIIGNFYPYLMNVGEKSIFPIILWQVYFVAGIILGGKGLLSINIMRKRILMVGCICLAIFLLLCIGRVGHKLFPSALLVSSFASVSKFPLNFMGLLYHSSLLILIYCFMYIIWINVAIIRSNASNLILIFGRHSLLAFIIHVYFISFLKLIFNYTHQNNLIVYLIVIINIIFSIIIFRIIDHRSESYF